MVVNGNIGDGWVKLGGTKINVDSYRDGKRERLGKSEDSAIAHARSNRCEPLIKTIQHTVLSGVWGVSP